MNAGNPFLRGEPNTTLGVRGPTNPFVGQLYFDASWKLDYHTARHEDTRLSVSYELDAKKFGSHRFAAMGSRVDEMDLRLGTWLGLAGAPFNPDPENANNRLTTRYYVTEGNPESFTLGDWRQVPRQITVDGATYGVIWVNQPAGNQNSLAEQNVNTLLGVAQSHFFKNRLVTTFGYREDEAKITSFGHAVDPVLRHMITDRDPAKTVVNQTKGTARSQGLVLHVTAECLAAGQHVDQRGVTGFPAQRSCPIRASPTPARGQGEDIGVSVSLFNRRLNGEGRVLPHEGGRQFRRGPGPLRQCQQPHCRRIRDRARRSWSTDHADRLDCPRRRAESRYLRCALRHEGGRLRVQRDGESDVRTGG